MSRWEFNRCVLCATLIKSVSVFTVRGENGPVLSAGRTQETQGWRTVSSSCSWPSIDTCIYATHGEEMHSQFLHWHHLTPREIHTWAILSSDSWVSVVSSFLTNINVYEIADVPFKDAATWTATSWFGVLQVKQQKKSLHSDQASEIKRLWVLDWYRGWGEKEAFLKKKKS